MITEGKRRGGEGFLSGRTDVRPAQTISRNSPPPRPGSDERMVEGGTACNLWARCQIITPLVIDQRSRKFRLSDHNLFEILIKHNLIKKSVSQLELIKHQSRHYNTQKHISIAPLVLIAIK